LSLATGKRRHLVSPGRYGVFPMTVQVTDDTFDSQVLKAEGPVLLDFWAEWCGPCKAIGPILEQMSGEMQGKLTVAKINIDENPMVPSKYGVRGIPTLMLFKNGQVAATKIGALPKTALYQWVESVLDTDAARAAR